MADAVLRDLLPNFKDDDIFNYLKDALASLEMLDNEDTVIETVAPFLVNANYCDEAKANEICKSIALKFLPSNAASASSSSSATSSTTTAAKATLLDAPVKIGANAIANPFPSEFQLTPIQRREQKKKEKEKLRSILQQQAIERAAEESRMNKARLAALLNIRASKNAVTFTGVVISRFSLPHPGGTGDLLSDAYLSLQPGRRYALTGRNGAGKSTLLRALANYELEGLSTVRIVMVDQHVEGNDDSALSWVLKADVERTALIEEHDRLTRLLEASEKGSSHSEVQAALADCDERMAVIDVATATVRAKKILMGLGFEDQMIDVATSQLSGGWSMRAALSAAIFANPDLLLLDEPTNHLDLHALVWLESYLVNKFTGTAVVVSHDYHFLNGICTDVLELRSALGGHRKATLDSFHGDYAAYTKAQAENRKLKEREREALEKEKEKLKEFISREGRKYDNPSHQAQRRMKIRQLEQLEAEDAEALEDESSVRITLPPPSGGYKSEDKLLGCAGLAFAWEGAPPLLDNVDLVILKKSRVVIMGKNGCGKTSLLNLLAGEAQPTKGSVTKMVGCRIQMLRQHHYRGEQLDPDMSPLDHIKMLTREEGDAGSSGVITTSLSTGGTKAEENQQRSYLASFSVDGARATLPVKSLSGGQRMRVALAVSLFRRPDVLILDEPTNHLDAHTVQSLCDALSTFEGAIVCVSHDESFVNHVMNIGGGENAELYVISKRQLQRQHSFAEYKRAIAKKVVI